MEQLGKPEDSSRPEIGPALLHFLTTTFEHDIFADGLSLGWGTDEPTSNIPPDVLL